MKPGEIYDLYIPFNPPIRPGQPRGKYRPALIVAVSPSGTAIALALKITGTPPNDSFPYRVPINFWKQANLDKKSYVELSTSREITISPNRQPRGELVPMDLTNVFLEYGKYTSR